MVSVQSFFKGVGICLFWIAVVFGFLYTPRFLQVTNADRSINVCMWPGVVDPKIISAFEKHSGIKVNLSSFDGNEELLVKLFATKGKGYDLIVTSDYCIETLIKNNLLRKIDKKKLDFWDAINPHFLGYYYDPKNEYSIPSDWYVLGFGVQKAHFKDGKIPAPRWACIFDLDNINYRMGVINDSRELAGLAINYLYGEVRAINDKEVQEVTNLLCRQKQYIEAYTDLRGDFLLKSGNCSLVLVPNNFIWRALEEDDSIGFCLPEDGIFLNIENFAIPKPSEKADMVYELLNYLFRLEVQEHNFNSDSFLSVRKDADFMYNNPYLASSVALVNPENPTRLEIFNNKLTDDQINNIWLTVKGTN